MALFLHILPDFFFSEVLGYWPEMGWGTLAAQGLGDSAPLIDVENFPVFLSRR